jgi:HEXXH motif-containing protein
MLDTHRVSLMSLDAMAEGRSDPAIVEQLRRANRSRQLTLLRAVLDRARVLVPDMAPSPSLEEAWTLLADAQQRDEAAADQVIAHPQTGVWAAKALRRLGKGNAADGDPPIWADLGYLHQLATAAAIRAGHDFQSRVPVWRGTVMLPTLGLADVQSRREWDFAQVHGEHGHVLVRGPAGSVQLPDNRAVDGAGWLALRTLRTGGCELWFDDLDPYREFDGPIPPHRLPACEVDLWAGSLRETWLLLTEHHPAIAAELATGLTTLVPRAPADRLTPFSASHIDAFGSVVLSRPSDATTFAAVLVHEFQHSKFGALLTMVDLLDPAGDNDIPRLYAPWRDDPRPPSGVLHGVFSFLGVTAFYREHYPVETGLPSRAAQFEFAYRREQTMHAADTLLADAAPSALGHRFLSTARDRLQAWGAEPLPQDVRAAAHRANVDHQLSWRLRHLRPPTAVVAELAQAWLRHRPKPVVAPAAPLLRPSTDFPVHPRLALARTWLTEPDLYDIYRAEPELAMAEIAGTTVADLALIDGDTGTAAELYRQQILARPDSSAAWAGLAMASADEVLLSQPELVYAVHQEIRARSGVVPNPARLARWLGAGR